jgi:predicted ATPase/DNA-binding SARP family transcriptional activator
LRLLGPFQARVQGVDLARTRSRKAVRLLALLALRAGCRVERSWLAGVLWPDSTTSRGLSLMRRELTDLRRVLGPAARLLLSPTPRTLQLDPAGAAIDLLDFDPAIARGDPDSLREAIRLYRGPLLEGWDEEWVLEARQAYEHRYLAALESLADLARKNGDDEEAECWLRRIVATDPLRESAHRALMHLLAEGGSPSAALRIYRELRELLHRQMNAAPDPETTALYRRIQSEVRESAPRRRSTDRPAHEREAISHNLPCLLTRFFGRRQEAAAVARLLRSRRLVTLTGAGGCGKTRLAMCVSADLARRFPDGVWWVDLAPLRDSLQVIQATASVLGVRQQGTSSLEQSLIDHLRDRHSLLVLDNAEHLTAACAGLTERLLHACPGVRILVTSREALGMAGEQVFRVPSLPVPETAAEGSLEALCAVESVQLFYDRAALSDSAFRPAPDNAAAVARICRRLDGIPLAIELAAARVRALPVERIAVGLQEMLPLLTSGRRTALPRHQTLRASLEWSYALLSGPEQRLLQRLSVFVGGWTLPAAEAIGADLPPTERVVDLLAVLVEKSLVVYEPAGHHPSGNGEEDVSRAEARYRLLEMVRQYAGERLAQGGEERAALERHARFYRAFSENRMPELRVPDHSAWFEQLEQELGNLRAALAWAEVHDPECALELVANLLPFWDYRGYWVEGCDWLERILPLASAQTLTPARAKVLHGAGIFTLWRGKSQEGEAYVEEALAAFRALNDSGGAADCLGLLGNVHRGRGDMAAADRCYQEGMSISRAMGDRERVAGFLALEGWLAADTGEYRRARDLLQQSVALYHEADSKAKGNWAVGNLGWVYLSLGEYDAAKRCYGESLEVARTLGDKMQVAICLCSLGLIALYQGDSETARVLLEQGRSVATDCGDTGRIAIAHNWLGLVAYTRGEYDTARRHQEECVRLSRALGDSTGLASALSPLSWTLLKQGEIERAHTCCREALQLWRRLNAGCEGVIAGLESTAAALAALDEPLQPVRLLATARAARDQGGAYLSLPYRTECDATLAALREALDEDAFAAAWAEGARLSLEAAVTAALGGDRCDTG